MVNYVVRSDQLRHTIEGKLWAGRA
uniref:Uncharacterized protein n=1 Tax=Arundo donax TaxID=35708 RepID=A0A0A8ZF70_ARUDO